MDLTVAVIGAGRSEPATDATAEEVGSRLAQAGVVVVCGGLGGVMAAACRGARAAGGRTVGILPGTTAREANPWVDLALPTGLGEARNVLVVRAGSAVIAVGGGFGTLSELAFARKLDVPVVGLDTWRLPDDGIVHVDAPEEAVREALAAARRG
ncbi:MAG TPA: TIGR00725 family protein [Euzebyales bacterium]